VTGPEAIDVEDALNRAVDPVGEPAGYVEMVLEVLGDRDPVMAQAELPAQIAEVLEQAGPRVRTRPAPDEWSAIEVFGHILDAEIANGARYRWILAQDEPELIGFDQDRWVERLRHQDDDPNEMMELFRSLRRSNLILWERASASDRARIGMHAERGAESFDLLFRLVAGHGLFHLGQMRRTLAQVADGPLSDPRAR
jgi:DinB superfamily